MKQFYPLSTFLTEYSEKNGGNTYRPVAIGRYGIRTRESIYSKELAKDYSKNKLIHKNTLTVGMGSVQIDIGVLTDDITYSVSPAYHTYKIAGVNAEYLRYCLECRNQDMFSRFVKRGSRQGKTIDLKRWLTYEIPVYDENRQQEIVDRLNQISELIEKRREQLVQLSELVKSRFIELFGDPLKNDKDFPTILGETLFKLSNGRALPNNKRFTVGIPAYGGNGISWYTDEILCDYDTVIIGRVGFQSGNVHLAKAPLWVTDNAMYISWINNKEYDIRFLCSLMEHIDFKRYQDAGDLKKITQKPFMQMYYLMPPVSLQKQYIAFVEQTDKSKLAVQKSLEELEILKKSLMQQYFG